MLWFSKEPTLHSAVVSGLIGVLSVLAWPQQYTKGDRDRAQGMLRDVARDVKKYYYDPKLHGVDWDATVRQAKENIDKAESLNSAVSEIAAALDRLNDSHTFFIPPPRTYVHNYGFTMQMIGDHCYVTRVRPDSDAATKGLKPGDEILAVNEHPLARKTFWKIPYVYETLQPQAGLRLTLAGEGGHPRQLEVAAKFQTSSKVKYFLRGGVNQWVRDEEDASHYMRARSFEKGDALLIVKIPEFYFSALSVDRILGEMRKHKGVVLDLRGNPGGSVDTLKRLLGGAFQNDLKICDRVGRNSSKAVSAAGRNHDVFIGRLAVLIDSESASASEVFARVLQLERRAFIVGDRSSGSVMEAKHYPHEVYVDAGVYYGASVTDADLIMTDGKSLEHVGVEPDILILPTAQDVATGRDPAM